MKKLILFAVVALLSGVSAMAQETEEVTYVQDPSQGYLFNRFKDNWFLTAEIGGGIYFSHGDKARRTIDRFSPGAGLYLGKWFSPVVAIRAGVHFLQCKGLSDIVTGVTMTDEPTYDGKYKQKFAEVGPAFDAMINLTNWWCGYKPDRRYNAIFYMGAGGFFTFARDYTDGTRGSWKSTHDRVLTWRAGLINTLRLSKQVDLSLDIRWNAIDNHQDESGAAWNRTSHDLQAYLGVTYKFKKREWEPPVVPVCPPAENCDALRARLEAAEAQIANLEDQLANALAQPEVVAAVVEEPEPPLATIYYPINIYALTTADKAVLDAVANVMKANPDKKYVLTGWADNYTGTPTINVRLRHNRVNGVERQLIKYGVPKSQLITQINDGNLCDMGIKYVAFDRATTITEAE